MCTAALCVYGALYDEVNSRLKRSGSTVRMGISKNGFLYSVQRMPGVADIGQMLQYTDPAEFLEVAYLGLLRRMPDSAAMTRWAQRTGVGILRYQKQVVLSLTGSAEFAGKGVQLINSPWKAEGTLRRQVLRGLHRVYQRLPKSFRDAARQGYHKLTGRE